MLSWPNGCVWDTRIFDYLVVFSDSLWLRKSDFLFFLSSFFSMAWKRISAQEVASFHSKKHKEHHYFAFMFNYEVLRSN